MLPGWPIVSIELADWIGPLLGQGGPLSGQEGAPDRPDISAVTQMCSPIRPQGSLSDQGNHRQTKEIPWNTKGPHVRPRGLSVCNRGPLTSHKCPLSGQRGPIKPRETLVRSGKVKGATCLVMGVLIRQSGSLGPSSANGGPQQAR